MISVHAITPWDAPGGISEYAKYLYDGLKQLRWPAPSVRMNPLVVGPPHSDIVWLNYHEATHAGPIVSWVLDQKRGRKVVVTYHNTFGEHTPEELRAHDDHRLDLAEQLYHAADAFIVHEPCAGFPDATVIRQGVPPWTGTYIWRHGPCTLPPSAVEEIIETTEQLQGLGQVIACNRRPCVGTMGYPFPWKNYDLLCEAAALAGWSTLLFAPGATDAQISRWRQLNPWTAVVRAFVPSEAIVAHLSRCDATAFLYTGAFAGTSGAIRHGIAARKPVLATQGCRQFRDLALDPVGQRAITWLPVVDPGKPEDLADWLLAQPLHGGIAPWVHRLAEQDSWANAAIQYARVFERVVGQNTTSSGDASTAQMSKGEAS